VLKMIAGAGTPMPMPLEKVGAGEKEMGIAGRVQHVTGDGVIHDLARLLSSFYTSLPKDPRLLSQAEKEELYQKIVRCTRRRRCVDGLRQRPCSPSRRP